MGKTTMAAVAGRTTKQALLRAKPAIFNQKATFVSLQSKTAKKAAWILGGLAWAEALLLPLLWLSQLSPVIWFFTLPRCHGVIMACLTHWTTTVYDVAMRSTNKCVLLVTVWNICATVILSELS